MSAPKTRGNAPTTPFHVELRRLREARYISASSIAVAAGCTVAIYLAMESGQVHVSQAVYDAAVKRLPQLSNHPAPTAPDPTPVPARVHPAVAAEQERVAVFLPLLKGLNIGATNRETVAKLVMLAIDGHLTAEDVDRYLR